MKDPGLKLWLVRHRGKATERHQVCLVTKSSADELKRAGGLETRCSDSMFYLKFTVTSSQSWKTNHRVENNLIAIQPEKKVFHEELIANSYIISEKPKKNLNT